MSNRQFHFMLPVAMGVVTGALSWAAAWAVSGKFEPYDSGVGLLFNQIVLCAPLVILTSRYLPSEPWLFLIGSHIGMNAYAYGFGGSEARAWAALGAIVSLLLLFLPLVVAVGMLVFHNWQGRKSLPEGHRPAPAHE